MGFKSGNRMNTLVRCQVGGDILEEVDFGRVEWIFIDYCNGGIVTRGGN